MPRPTTKQELLNVANENFEKLWNTIDGLTEQELNTPFDFSSYPKLTEAHRGRDKNIRDILVHLYERHQLLLNWITKNQQGKTTNFLPDPYTFKTIAPMNETFREKYQATPYEKAVELLKASHDAVIKCIESFTNEELFTKKHFPWTGTTTLGSYCISSTSSHYDRAIKKIKKHKKIVGDK